MIRLLTARKCALRPKLVAYLGLSALAAIGGVPARGASIASYLKHHASPPHIQATEVKALQTFLAGGPTHWAAALPPKFPNGLVIADSTGNLLNKPVVNYLIWKRDLNTAYFDARHPRVAPLFQQYDNQKAQILAAIYAQYPPKAHAATGTASLSARTAKFQVLTPPATVAAQNLSNDVLTVPEPASVVSTLVVFASAGAWWRARRRASV
jgi:hypothetical protein